MHSVRQGDLAPEVCSVVIAVLLVSATFVPAFTLIEQVQLHIGFTKLVYVRVCWPCGELYVLYVVCETVSTPQQSWCSGVHCQVYHQPQYV